MKISNGSVLELLLGIFFLYTGFNIENSFTSVAVIMISIIVIIHVFYLFFHEKRKLDYSHNRENSIQHTFTIFTIITIILLFFNIVLLVIVGNNYYKKIQKQENFKKCIKKVKYSNNFIIDSSGNVKNTEYILSEKDFQKLEQCYKKINIKIEK